MNIDVETRVDLVTTIPEPYGRYLSYITRSRTTAGVLVDLISQARLKIVAGAPYMQGDHGFGTGVLGVALRAALERGVNVDLVGTGAALATVNKTSLTYQAQGRLRLLCGADHARDEQRLGSHAKFCVVDGMRAYVGSANFTGPGLSGQLEMGILVHGSIAKQIEEFWTSAIELGLIVVMP